MSEEDPNVLIYDDPVLYERFIKEYFNLNPKGNALQTWANLRSQSHYGSGDANGNPITIEALAENYKQYLLYWRRTFDSKDEKYISKDDRLMDPETFVSMKMYQSVWKSAITPRDNYLFGNKTEEYYAQRTKEFIDALPKAKIKP